MKKKSNKISFSKKLTELAVKSLMERLNDSGSICLDCAKKLGGKMPNGYCCTMSMSGKCPVCLEEKVTTALTDFVWPKGYPWTFVFD